MKLTLATALYWQLIYAVLVVAWQVAGIASGYVGRPTPGPTADASLIAIAITFAALFWWSARERPLLFVSFSAIVAVGAGMTLWNTFRPGVDLSLWSSTTARDLGALINLFGLAGFVVATLAYVRHVRAEAAE